MRIGGRELVFLVEGKLDLSFTSINRCAWCRDLSRSSDRVRESGDSLRLHFLCF